MLKLFMLFFVMGNSHSVATLSPPIQFPTPIYAELERGQYVVLVNLEGTSALFRMNVDAFFALGAKGLPTSWASVSEAQVPFEQAVAWTQAEYADHGQELKSVLGMPVAKALTAEPAALRTARREFSVEKLIRTVERAEQAQ